MEEETLHRAFAVFEKRFQNQRYRRATGLDEERAIEIKRNMCKNAGVSSGDPCTHLFTYCSIFVFP